MIYVFQILQMHKDTLILQMGRSHNKDFKRLTNDSYK